MKTERTLCRIKCSLDRMASTGRVLDAMILALFLPVWAWMIMSSWNLLVVPVHIVPSIGFTETLSVLLLLRILWGRLYRLAVEKMGRLRYDSV